MLFSERGEIFDFEQAGEYGVAVCEQKSKEQVRRGLHSQGDFHGN